MIPDDATLAEWRRRWEARDENTRIDTQCPEEFGVLLDAVAELKSQVGALEMVVKSLTTNAEDRDGQLTLLIGAAKAVLRDPTSPTLLYLKSILHTIENGVT